MPKPLKWLIRIAAWLVAIGVFAWGASLYFRVADVSMFQRANTALLNFDARWLAPFAGTDYAFAGGLALHRDGVFASQRAEGGEVYFLPADEVALLPTGLKLPPINRSRIPDRTPKGQQIDRGLLRYNDLAVLELSGVEHLVVSYSFYHEEDACFVNRVATTPLPGGWLDAVRAKRDAGFGDWTVVFETAPCLPLVEGAGFPFTGHQAGGRMAVAPTGKIYLTVGDFGFDGTEGKLPPYPLLPDNSYGRVLELHPTGDTWTTDEVAMGLRNPQGIDVDARGRIWEAEHAAMGGDELNLIERGGNYGWPAVTVGINYVEDDSDQKYWPFNPETGHHGGYVPPVYAWVPSIAPSNLKYVTGLSPRWDGNLLVGALKGQAIVRLQLEGDHVIVAETIPVGKRVRYLEVGHGRLYILFDQGEIAVLTPREMGSEYVDISALMDIVYDPDDPEAVPIVGSGSVLASRGCIECHSGPDAPKLRGLFEQPIASQPGVEYSPALAAKGGTWTDANLRAFLRDPKAFAPGTTMPDRALSEDDLTSIIEAMKVQQHR